MLETISALSPIIGMLYYYIYVYLLMVHAMAQSCIIITGPTGVGKTACVDELATRFPIEIVNVDMGQMYTPLSIGTAKPDWRNSDIPHHAFDIIDEPRDFSVTEYRLHVLQALTDIWRREKTPVLVGGSLFYIKSIFFPPSYTPSNLDFSEDTDPYALWNHLYAIDPDRAQAIHPNDVYRVRRALAIWYTTGYRPSTFQPKFMPPSSAYIAFLNRDRNELYKRIDRRTHDMLASGWIQEVENLSEDWKSFLQQKHILGYPEVIAYINGDITYHELVTRVQKKTRAYAKRQITFWRSLQKQLIDAFAEHSEYSGYITSLSLTEQDYASCAHMIHQWYAKGV